MTQFTCPWCGSSEFSLVYESMPCTWEELAEVVTPAELAMVSIAANDSRLIACCTRTRTGDCGFRTSVTEIDLDMSSREVSTGISSVDEITG
jgi:hypothetical protein